MYSANIRQFRLILTCIQLICLVETGFSAGRYEEENRINALAYNTRTPGLRAKAIAGLVEIVGDETTHVNFRALAAERLGELKPIEVRQTLKTVAEKLEWKDPYWQLKDAVTVAYWQGEVAARPSEEEQRQLLLKLLWPEKHEPPHASMVGIWAVDELANRGVKSALPEMAKRIEFDYSGTYGAKLVRLCTTKVELLNSHPTRYDALVKALRMEDSDQDQRLRHWAIKELGKLETKESRDALATFALDLEHRYYDQEGDRMKSKPDADQNLVERGHAASIYRYIITTLERGGMNGPQIKAAGLHPDQCFFVAH
jgi:hypothetical protein